MQNRFEIQKPVESYPIDEIEGFLKTFTPLELSIIRTLYDFNASMHVKSILDVCIRELYGAVIELSEKAFKNKSGIKQSDFQKAGSKIQYYYNAVEFTPSKIENFINSFSEDYGKIIKAKGMEETKIYSLKNSNDENAQLPDYIFNEIIRKNLSGSGIAKIPSFNTIEKTLEGLEQEVVIERKLEGKKANAVYALNPHFYALLKKIWLIIFIALTSFTIFSKTVVGSLLPTVIFN
jgi:hypothetical protein